MGATAHLRKHGAVHALWVISVLLFVIAWLLLETPNGELIGNYIGFAASVASLVLAVVAIGYSFISNQSMTETVTALRTSSGDLGSAAENIAATSAILSTRAEELTGHVAQVPLAMEALSARFDEKVFRAPDNDTSTELPLEPSNTSDAYLRSRVGSKLILYVLAKSFLEKKSFLAGSMFPGGTYEVWNNIVLGGTLLAHGTSPCGISIALKEEGGKNFSETTSFGSLDAGFVARQFSLSEDETMTKLKQLVDDYFSSNADFSGNVETSDQSPA